MPCCQYVPSEYVVSLIDKPYSGLLWSVNEPQDKSTSAGPLNGDYKGAALLELQQNLGTLVIVWSFFVSRISIGDLSSSARSGNVEPTRLLSALRLIITVGRERVAMLTMLLSLWMLSVLSLQHGTQGTRMVSARVGGDLPLCNFPGAMPGLDCFDPPKLANLPPCEFRHQRVGIDCWPKSSPADKAWTPVTKFSWLSCFKCFEIVLHCGICFVEFAGLVRSHNPTPNVTHEAVSTLNFYNVDTDVRANFYDVAIVAEHETHPIRTKTIRVWKSSSGYPNNVNPIGNLSSLAFCDYNQCLTSIHNCLTCLGNQGTQTAAPVSASYNFDTSLAPFYDVAIVSEQEYLPIKTKTVRDIFPNELDRPVGRWRAKFSLDEKFLEISMANDTDTDALTLDQSNRFQNGPLGGRLPPCKDVKGGIIYWDCYP
ncbi:hypothetical protein KC19_5G008500 [Ceratodon purpureus]|uniref:Uncharacterized protein n=1 Tax=Ceratodon purpureus TaxID=3225 RepID=A0A8T0HYI5_CERPU|nr:hypothetical protein KC19_5G008500 [Ceratodon purpureus]